MSNMVLGTFSLHDRKRFSEYKAKHPNEFIKSVVNHAADEKHIFEKELNRIACSYYSFKLAHNGLISYKSFENCNRKMKRNSLLNLLNQTNENDNGNFSSIPFDSCLGYLPNDKELTRKLTEQQSKKIKKYCSKLCYYSSERHFMSKTSGKYKFKVAFLTLTAPESATTVQILKAFTNFLNYLRRTANCVYVWKKELGSKNGKLHFHIMINNFIPFYIVDWKWKRLLIAEGIDWPVNEKGEHTKSHYRIELPKNARIVGGYMAKYMSKVESMDKELGYIWGKSSVLDECKEIVLTEGDVNNDELYKIYSKFKTIGQDFVKICLVDLMKIKDIAPELFSLFKDQYKDFNSRISLPQRFQTV